MMSLEIIIAVLTVRIVILVLLLAGYQRQVKIICRQLRFWKKYDSNLMISREIEWGGIGDLADILNEMLELRKREKKKYMEKEQMISDIYTNLSHDIRTPLTSLDGYFQMLETAKEEKEQKRYIRIIRKELRASMICWRNCLRIQN